MKTILLKFLMTISTLIPFMNTPLAMGILLLIHTTLSTMLISSMMTSSWLSMMMFLMFVGGILIIFMYMSSIASNEKFTPNIKLTLMIILIMIPMEEMLLNYKMMDNLISFTNKEMITLTKIFNMKNFIITILMFLYMYLTMVVVTKIIKIHMGPLRSKYE